DFGLNNVGAASNPAYSDTIPEILYFAFQLKFAAITPALIIGAFAERIRFKSLMIYIVAWTTFVYVPIAHWNWGLGGWLKSLGVIDFAGGLVVHTAAGVAAVVCNYVASWRARTTLDDSLDVFACHGAGGIWGALATGLFASSLINPAGPNGLFFGNPGQLGIQTLACVVVAAFAFAGSYVLLRIINIFSPVRVSPAEEDAGLDISGFGEEAYVAEADKSRPASECRSIGYRGLHSGSECRNLQEREDPLIEGIDLRHPSDRGARRFEEGCKLLRRATFPQGDVG